VWPRLLTLLLVVALVPTAELTEQVVHVVEHVLEHEDAAHSAHHDETPADCEHGCTGLIHLCQCHTTVAVTPAIATVSRAIVPTASLSWSPARLHDAAAREPADRPPIG
jgi:hypothetical protein